MPSASLDRSKVVPEGTATLERTIVEHAVWDLEADAAPAEPEKVQLVARLTTSALGAGVIWGSAAGAARAATPKEVIKRPRDKATIVNQVNRAWY